MKTLKIKRIFLVLLLFYILFPFYLNLIPTFQKIAISFILIGPFFIYLYRYKCIFAGNKIIFQCLVLLFFIYIILVYLSIISIFLLHQSNDISYTFHLVNNIVRIIKLQLLFIGLYSISKKNDILLLFLKIYVYACVIYILSTIIFLIFPNIKDIWYSIIYIDDNTSDRNFGNITEYITRWGLSGFSGFSNTHACSIAVLFCLFLIENDRKKNQCFIYYVYLFICLLGTFFYGRIGMMCSLFFLGVFFIYRIVAYKDFKLALFIILIISIIASVLFWLVSINSMINTWFKWAFEPFIRFFETGELGAANNDYLFEKMYYPLRTETWLLGEGYFDIFPRSLGYNFSDSGILRPIIFYGIIPTIMQYCILFLLLISVKYVIKKSHYKFSNLFILLLLSEMIIFTIKGLIYQNEIDLYLILLSILLLQNIRNRSCTV